MKQLPRVLMFAVGALSAAIVLSSLAFGIAVLFVGPKPAWMIFGFEIVSMVAGVMGILLAVGRFQEGQGMTLACVAATTAVAAFLAWLSVPAGLEINGRNEPLNLTNWLFAREGASVLLGGIAAFAVLSRDRRSLSYLTKSIITGAPVLALAGGAFVGRHSLGPMLAAMPVWLSMLLACIMGVILVGLLSACGHCLIRAFEMGRIEGKQPNA